VTLDRRFEDLVPGFLSNRARDLARLRQALLDDDHLASREIGHRLKGSLDTYGFRHAARLAAEIEALARKRLRDAAVARLEELEAHLARVEVRYG
jgi:HPt (histidine-containing phosphotransfer) domain-containing protein